MERIYGYGLAIASVTLAAVIQVSCSKTTEQPTATKAGGETSTAPSGKEVAKRDNALVRFVDATTPGTAYDLWFGDTKVFPNVSRKEVTPYHELASERGEFRLRPAGKDTATPVATNSEGLTSGRHYTILAVTKDDGTVTLNAINDDLSAPPSGKAKVRVINAAPHVGEVDVIEQGKKDKLFSGVNFNTAESYKDVDPMKGPLEVRKKGQSRPATRIPDVDLVAGKIYTIVVTGGKTRGTLDAIKIEDQLVGTAESAGRP